MAYNDGVKTAPVAYIGVVSVLVTIIIVMALQILFFHERDDIRTADELSQGPPEELADLTAQQWTALTRREVVDRERNIVTIGIARAKDLVVSELASGRDPASVIGPNLAVGSPKAATEAPQSTDSQPPVAPKGAPPEEKIATPPEKKEAEPPKEAAKAPQEKKDDAKS